jgi:hypothetical protein
MRAALKKLLFAFPIAAALCTYAGAQSRTTQVCLGLLGDSSTSVASSSVTVRDMFTQLDPNRDIPRVRELKRNAADEYAQMVSGMADAFRDAKVIQAIVNNAPVAVSYVEFSDDPSVRIGWEKLVSEKDAYTFAAKLDNLYRTLYGGTHTFHALIFMAKHLKDECPNTGSDTRYVLDLATDDRPYYSDWDRKSGDDIMAQGYRKNMQDRKITLNAMAMLTKGSNHTGSFGYQSLLDYLEQNLATGRVFEVLNPQGYKDAFVRKFSYEISDRPAVSWKAAANAHQLSLPAR